MCSSQFTSLTSVWPLFTVLPSVLQLKTVYDNVSVHGRNVLVLLLCVSSKIVQKISNPLLIVLSDPSCHIDSLAV